MTDVSTLTGSTVVDSSGDKIGKVAQVYLDDRTGEPQWVTVKTGLFGTKESFVPLAASRVEGDQVVVNATKTQVTDAPQVDEDGHISEAEEADLYRYYGLSYGDSGYDTTTTTTTGTTSGYETGTRSETYDTGRDVSGRNTDDAMTRSEEHLVAGTERVEAGRARLRKYVVTDTETVQVPVRREEVRLEREPITDANRDAAYSGGDITEEEHEITLHAERAVVGTEAEAVERVRLGKETVTGTETVSGEVRKEQIELDDPTGTARENR